jgi:acetyl-CoA acetyltransferase
MLLTGQAKYVLIAKADNLATGMSRTATVESMATIGHPQYEAPSGPLIPALYALLAARYMHETPITSEQIALAAVTDRKWAELNPAAQYRSPLSVDDVLGSKMIADPLHLLDCAPISDAGAAILVTTSERARDLRRSPVSLLGIGETHDFEHVSQAPDLGRTGAASSGETAFAMAEVDRPDIDVAMVYDAFSFIQPMQLEDLGFCGRGEGGEFIASGATAPGGLLPTNTHGGVLSHSHAGKSSSLLQFTEAVAQLRGDCGERQVADAELALVHTEGGILASHCTAILGRDR